MRTDAIDPRLGNTPAADTASVNVGEGRRAKANDSAPTCELISAQTDA